MAGQLVVSAAAGGGVQLAIPGLPAATEGNDTITGTDQVDEIEGLGGDGPADGLGGNDKLSGNAGDDTLDGGAGDDLLNGGDGTDTAFYASAAAGVSVTLGANGSGGTNMDGLQQATGGAGADTLTSIEDLTGSELNDALKGLGTPSRDLEACWTAAGATISCSAAPAGTR